MPLVILLFLPATVVIKEENILWKGKKKQLDNSPPLKIVTQPCLPQEVVATAELWRPQEVAAAADDTNVLMLRFGYPKEVPICPRLHVTRWLTGPTTRIFNPTK
ncbi:hypothetical protein LguiA_030344 [Lonicera macranthoides]